MNNVLVIGASRGIGLELVRQYREAGDRVIATARDDAGLAVLRDLGAQALRVDVADPASVSGFSWLLDGEKLDVAWYVAGVGDRAATVSPPTREKFDQLMHTNAMGPMMVLPQIAPMLAERAGIFAAISSHFGSFALTETGMAALYRMPKTALNMYIRCAQHDFPDVTCLALHPGWVQTEMGGPQAPMSVAQSVTSLRSTVTRAPGTSAWRGAFLNHDGTPLPW